AMRAAPRTSPFLASPSSTVASVLAVMRTKPSAIATRVVTSLAPTSTMRASPRLPTCESFFALAIVSSGGRDFVRRQQRARRCRHVCLAHQALAHQEGADVHLGEAGEGGRGKKSAPPGHAAIGRRAPRPAPRPWPRRA